MVNEFIRLNGVEGKKYLDTLGDFQLHMIPTEQAESSGLSFNNDMGEQLSKLLASEKSQMSAILHGNNLEKLGVKGLHSVTTDKASDAMAFVRKLRIIRATVDTKLLYWQSGWQHNLKCTIEAATEFSFGVVDPEFLKGGERGKIRHFSQHACQLGKLYGLKLKTFSESRFEGCIDS